MGTTPVAVVTGAASGIGASTVSRLTDDFPKVVALDHDADRLRQMWESHSAVDAVPADVRDEQSVQDALSRIDASAHHIAAVVNCAGIYRSGDIEAQPLAEIDDMWSINSRGALVAARIALPSMREGGAIVNISSTASMLSTDTNWAYGATKGAVNALTRGMAISLAPSRIRVNAVAPGPISTPMADLATADPDYAARMYDRIPLGRPGAPQDVSELVAFLVSDRAAWLTGQTVVLDGGLSVAR